MDAKVFFGSNEYENGIWEERISPYDGKVVSRSVQCSADDVDKAMNIAQSACKATRESTISQRCNWMHDVANKIEANCEDFAKTITDEMGKPIAIARTEVSRACETIRLAAETMRTMHGETMNTDAMPSGAKTIAFFKRVPVGVIAAITPFNFPLNLVAHKLAPALVAGNTVVLKPTTECSLTAYKFAKIIIESPYAIKDALSVVYGHAEVGTAMVKSAIPRKVSFTGSVPVGEFITKNAGIKKVSLELGGNAATYIDSTADIDMAAARCSLGAFSNSGQVCISLQRIYVHADIYDAFAEKLVEESKKLKVGSPYEEDTFMGPLINDDAVERATNWVESAKSEGARAILEPVVEGRMFTPCIMADVTDDMKIVCEEIFAPVVSLVKVDSYNTAVKKINNSPFGLNFSIFTNNIQTMKKAIDDLEAGGVIINDMPTLRFDIQPYGGMKLSGIGREGPRFAIKEMTEIKAVIIK